MTTIALVGNPNTGKTTLFNALAGMNQRVGNYPGVTVETKKGRMAHGERSFDLVDLPGTYSLAPRSPDEMVAVDLVLGHQAGEPRPDVILSIVDASNLERNLYLTTQVLELGAPVVVALNMLDVAESKGIRIDTERLAKQLGVPVVPIQANKRRGLDKLKKALAEAAGAAAPLKQPAFPTVFEAEAATLGKALGSPVEPFLLRRLLLDIGGQTEERLARKEGEPFRKSVNEARARLATVGCPVPAVEARTRYGWLREVTAGCVQRPSERPVTWTDRLDRVLTHRIWGTVVFAVLMFLVFQAIFTWARPIMKIISDSQDWVVKALHELLPPGALSSLFVDGVIVGVGNVIVFLPQIIILFGFIAILEDCGYMARAAFLMDRLMSRCGLSGKSFIPMLSSVACAVPGIMATRVIENRRDRLATILVAPLMSCSARLPVYILLIGAFLTVGYPIWLPGLVMFAMYMIGIILAPVVALLLKRTLLRGETPVFVMEMPMYKVPSIRTVLRRVVDSAWAFLYRAGTMILASMVLVWALLYFPTTRPDGGTYPEKIAEVRASLGDRKADLVKIREEQLKPLETRAHELRGQLRNAPENEKRAIEAEIAQTEKDRDALAPQLKPLEDMEDEVNNLLGEWKKQSYLGQLGQAIEPAVRPLGWDWRLGVAALASFPAREVVVGTLGIIYKQGEDVDPEDYRKSDFADIPETDLGKALQEARWDDDPERKVFTVPVALSLMVFFALCCQCASTLAVIRRETKSWGWPVFTFTYMTLLAYIGAFLTYQVGRLF
jgi:ferrous iron transport protein B